MANSIPVTATRYPELGLAKVHGHIWRFVSRDSASVPFDPYTGCVGFSYRTKTEALADLERFARDYGCAESAHPTRAEALAFVDARARATAPQETAPTCPKCGAEL